MRLKSRLATELRVQQSTYQAQPSEENRDPVTQKPKEFSQNLETDDKANSVD